MYIILVPLFRRLLTFKLRAKGYSAEQRSRLVGAIGDGKIIEWIKKYGPYILEIILKLLPLFLALERPKSKADTKLDKWVDETFAEDEGNLKVPFSESEELEYLMSEVV